VGKLNITRKMAKFIIISTRVIVYLVLGLSLFVSGCKNQVESGQNYIPDEIIVKGLTFVLKDKRYDRVLSKEVRIKKNLLVNNMTSFKVGKYNISMIDSVGESSKTNNDIAFFEFYNFNIYSSGKIDVTYFMSRTHMNVQLIFEQKNGEWVIVESNPYFL
jgi:hypothetical protein